MPTIQIEAPLEQRSARLRYWLAAALMLVAIALFYVAANFAIGEYLKVELVQRWENRPLTRIWFTADGALAGTRIEGRQLVVERWSILDRSSEGWRIPLASGTAENVPPFAVSEDATRVVWLEGERLHAAELQAQRNGEILRLPDIALQPGAKVAAFGPLGGGLAAVLYGDAALDTYNLDKGQRVFQRKLDLNDVDQAVMSGDYLAVASYRSARMRLYRLTGAGG